MQDAVGASGEPCPVTAPTKLKLNFNPFPILETPRLVLRRIGENDAPVLFFIRSDEAMMRYVDRDKATSIDDALLLIQKIDHELESAQGSPGVWLSRKSLRL